LGPKEKVEKTVGHTGQKTTDNKAIGGKDGRKKNRGEYTAYSRVEKRKRGNPKKKGEGCAGVAQMSRGAISKKKKSGWAGNWKGFSTKERVGRKSHLASHVLTRTGRDQKGTQCKIAKREGQNLRRDAKTNSYQDQDHTPA